MNGFRPPSLYSTPLTKESKAASWSRRASCGARRRRASAPPVAVGAAAAGAGLAGGTTARRVRAMATAAAH
ncbi:hypothetical protein K1T71_007186 [Dendrolimus kikuchii]|uniref:Uncharacterized protein n=1 Tax=Dendrolimus kikuchii TaxID=765133 RepID=A0ACC1D0X0_9NEOP|nr:hypothetical protein K1T71_007186 [Dendrolimus kikuchii]